MNRKMLSRLVLVGVALAVLAGCGSNSGDNGGTSGGDNANGSNLSGELKASGASFPDAYYQEVISAFKEKAPDVTVTYNAVGSGTGKKEFGQGLTDFAGSDSLVKDDDGVPPGSFLYVPTVAGPITVSYNLSGVDKLQLSPDTLANIFQAKITKWNDLALAKDNQGASLPDMPITVAHRSDGSGTTSNFTKYLTAASPEWKLGSGDTVAWPPGTQGAEKNTGVAQIIKQTDGGIGYVDYSDAVETKLNLAAIKNKDGARRRHLSGARRQDQGRPHLRPAQRRRCRRLPDHRADLPADQGQVRRRDQGQPRQGVRALRADRRAADRQGRQLRVAAQRPAAEGPRAAGQGPELTLNAPTPRRAIAGVGSTRSAPARQRGLLEQM